MNEIIEADVVTGQDLAPQPKEGVDLLANLLQLEKQMQAYKKLIGIAIQFTEPGDWTDQQGTPYMLVSGASKVAAPFGISISAPAFSREVRHDAKGEWYLYTCQLIAKCAVLGIERGFIGTCSSRDKFFATSTEWRQADGKKEKFTTLKPIEDVDEGNVKKKAYTNAFNNAVQNLLGLKKLSWEYLGQHGIKKDQAAKVEYGGKGATETVTEAQSKMLYAKMKNKVQQGASEDVIKEDFEKEFGVKDFKDLPRGKVNDAIAFLDGIHV